MRFSIVTINLNNRLGLLKTIQSISCQNFIDFEYIVIDGGSVDGSLGIIETHPLVSHYISEKDNGIYHAMNKGIENSSGDYILFLNSGDLLFDRSTLKKVNDYIDVNLDYEIYFGDVFSKNRVLNPNSEASLALFLGGFLPHQATFAKRKLFNGNKFDETFKIAGDLDWLLSSYLRGVRFSKMDFCIAFYDAGGISSVKSNQTLSFEKMSIFEKNKASFDYALLNDEIVNLAFRTKQFTTLKRKLILYILKLLINGFEVFSFYQIKSYWKGKIK